MPTTSSTSSNSARITACSKSKSPANGWAKTSSVVKANVRKEYGINVLAVKKSDSSVVLASGDYIFREDDHVIVAGASKNVDRLKH